MTCKVRKIGFMAEIEINGKKLPVEFNGADLVIHGCAFSLAESLLDWMTIGCQADEITKMEHVIDAHSISKQTALPLEVAASVPIVSESLQAPIVKKEEVPIKAIPEALEVEVFAPEKVPVELPKEEKLEPPPKRQMADGKVDEQLLDSLSHLQRFSDIISLLYASGIKSEQDILAECTRLKEVLPPLRAIRNLQDRVKGSMAYLVGD